jgi:hypothetical protein
LNNKTKPRYFSIFKVFLTFTSLTSYKNLMKYSRELPQVAGFNVQIFGLWVKSELIAQNSIESEKLHIFIP